MSNAELISIFVHIGSIVVPAGIAIASGVIYITRKMSSINTRIERIDSLESKFTLCREAWKKALYKEDGTTIYLPRGEHVIMQNKCQEGIAKIIELNLASIRQEIAANERSRTEQMQQITEAMKQMSTSMRDLGEAAARFVQWAKDHDTYQHSGGNGQHRLNNNVGI